MSKRKSIVDALVILFKEIDGESPYASNLYENVKPKQIFLDEVHDYPTVCVYSGNENRQYQPGGFKWGFLGITIRIYVQDDEAKDRIEEIFDDLEFVLDQNNDLIIDGSTLCTDIRILSLTDDEGLLNPLGAGEITLEIRYEV